MSDTITIKGGRDGLRLRLESEAEWEAIMNRLREQLEQNRNFFNGAKATVEIGARRLDQSQITQLATTLTQYGLQVEALDASERQSRSAARAIGINTRPLPRYDAAAKQSESEAIVVVRTVRSGQVVSHSGHITLIGDVNPGAEIIAGGSVIVWGRLRGLVHAGAFGKRDAVVCALELRPTQLRIADQITRTPDDASYSGPETARLDQDQIVVSTWEMHRR